MDKEKLITVGNVPPPGTNPDVWLIAVVYNDAGPQRASVLNFFTQANKPEVNVNWLCTAKRFVELFHKNPTSVRDMWWDLQTYDAMNNCQDVYRYADHLTQDITPGVVARMMKRWAAYKAEF